MSYGQRSKLQFNTLSGPWYLRGLVGCLLLTLLVGDPLNLLRLTKHTFASPARTDPQPEERESEDAGKSALSSHPRRLARVCHAQGATRNEDWLAYHRSPSPGRTAGQAAEPNGPARVPVPLRC